VTNLWPSDSKSYWNSILIQVLEQCVNGSNISNFHTNVFNVHHNTRIVSLHETLSFFFNSKNAKVQNERGSSKLHFLEYWKINSPAGRYCSIALHSRIQHHALLDCEFCSVHSFTNQAKSIWIQGNCSNTTFRRYVFSQYSPNTLEGYLVITSSLHFAVFCCATYMLISGSGSGSGVGVFTTIDGEGVGTTVSWDTSGSWTDGSGVDILAGGEWAGGGVGTGVETGVFTSETYSGE